MLSQVVTAVIRSVERRVVFGLLVEEWRLEMNRTFRHSCLKARTILRSKRRNKEAVY